MLAPAGVKSTISYVKKRSQKCRKKSSTRPRCTMWMLFLFIVFHRTNLEASSTFGCLFQHPTARKQSSARKSVSCRTLMKEMLKNPEDRLKGHVCPAFLRWDWLEIYSSSCGSIFEIKLDWSLSLWLMLPKITMFSPHLSKSPHDFVH